MVYGGTVRPGKWKGEDLNIVSAFEAYGKRLGNAISDEDYDGIIKNSIPGPGACGGMYTANTMSSAFEAMGMSLPYSSTMANEDKENETNTREAADALLNLLEQNIRPSDIITRKSGPNRGRPVRIREISADRWQFMPGRDSHRIRGVPGRGRGSIRPPACRGW